MKGIALGALAVCALVPSSAAPALASATLTSAPVPHFAQAPHVARAPRANEIRFETVRHHRPGDEISLGDTYSVPDATPPDAPEVAAAPESAPVEAAPAETPSHGPHIIYIGKETERQRTGFMPQVIYGDLPSRTATGPEVLYGTTTR